MEEVVTVSNTSDLYMCMYVYVCVCVCVRARAHIYIYIYIYLFIYLFIGVRIAWSVQRLATDWTVRGSNSGGGESFHTRPAGPGSHPPSCRMGNRSLCQG
jgi:hypothetical protein